MIRKIDRGLIEPFMFTPTRVIKVDVKHRFGGFDSKQTSGKYRRQKTTRSINASPFRLCNHGHNPVFCQLEEEDLLPFPYHSLQKKLICPG